MIVEKLIFKLARLYGKYSPMTIRKWQICLGILSIGKIHPWNNTNNYERFISNLEPLIVTTADGISINCNYEQDLGFILTNSYEQYTCNIIKNIVQKGDTILDFGANIGFMSLYFSLCSGSKGKIFAFEPVSITAKLMKKNINLNHNLKKAPILLSKVALGSSNEVMEINIPSTATGRALEIGQASLIKGAKGAGRIMNTEKIQILPLDGIDYIQDNISIVKCDVEGFELEFLKGAINTLIRDKPIMILELNPGINTYTSKEIIDFIQSIGAYELYKIRYFGLEKLDLNDIIKDTTDVVCMLPNLHKNLFVNIKIVHEH